MSTTDSPESINNVANRVVSFTNEESGLPSTVAPALFNARPQQCEHLPAHPSMLSDRVEHEAQFFRASETRSTSYPAFWLKIMYASPVNPEERPNKTTHVVFDVNLLSDHNFVADSNVPHVRAAMKSSNSFGGQTRCLSCSQGFLLEDSLVCGCQNALLITDDGDLGQVVTF